MEQSFSVQIVRENEIGVAILIRNEKGELIEWKRVALTADLEDIIGSLVTAFEYTTREFLSPTDTGYFSLLYDDIPY